MYVEYLYLNVSGYVNLTPSKLYYSERTLKYLEYSYGLHGYGITLTGRIDFYTHSFILRSFRLKFKI